MKPVDVKSNTYIDFDKENNKEDPKFKVADHLWVSKFRNIFAIIYTSNWSEKDFLMKKLKPLVCGHLLLMTLTVTKLLDLLQEKNFKNNLELK